MIFRESDHSYRFIIQSYPDLKVFLKESVPDDNAVPGAAIATESFGDFPGFNPRCHILVTHSIITQQA